jgi:hypothetical protein
VQSEKCKTTSERKKATTPAGRQIKFKTFVFFVIDYFTLYLPAGRQALLFLAFRF